MILIGNGTVVTRDEACPLIPHGGVLTEGTKIVRVGDFETLKKEYPGAEVLDAGGGLIGAWFALLVDQFLRFAFSFGRFLSGRWKNIRI